MRKRTRSTGVARERKLARSLEQYRDRSGRNFDCVVPVSGARDSYFIVHTLVKDYGLKPLLVSYNRHHNTERGIRNLAYLRTHFRRRLYAAGGGAADDQNGSPARRSGASDHFIGTCLPARPLGRCRWRCG